INQTVQLRIDSYPYQEYGYLNGRITYISDIPTDSGFLAHIILQKGQTTNLNKQLHYREGLKGEALIITKELRLAERLFYKVNSTLSR
ncbi:MAG: HlyD family secretion protein, partial [Bacteroidota bacterium]